MRILCVEPNPACATSIELMLKSECMNVYTTDLGEEAIELAKLYDYDLMLLELCLSDMSGIEVIKQLTQAKCKTPILVVSRLAHIKDKVMTLGLGAADHIAKPFHRDELVARILAIVRRCNGHCSSQIELGVLKMDLYLRTLQVKGGRPIYLTRKEYSIMEILMLRIGKTLTREQIMNHLYGDDAPEMKVIDVFLSKLRAKLTAAGAPDAIETVWGRGLGMRIPKLPPLKQCLDIA